MDTGNKSAKFHGNILSLTENIARSFFCWGGGYFFDSYCIYRPIKRHSHSNEFASWNSHSTTANFHRGFILTCWQSWLIHFGISLLCFIVVLIELMSLCSIRHCYCC